MQKQILDKNPTSDLRVYAVWLPMRFTDKYSRAGARVLSDARVKHFWDGEKVIGRWFADEEGYSGQVAWDIYFLYGPEATWDLAPAPLVNSGVTVFGKRKELLQTLLPLLKD